MGKKNKEAKPETTTTTHHNNKGLQQQVEEKKEKKSKRFSVAISKGNPALLGLCADV